MLLVRDEVAKVIQGCIKLVPEWTEEDIPVEMNESGVRFEGSDLKRVTGSFVLASPCGEEVLGIGTGVYLPILVDRRENYI